MQGETCAEAVHRLEVGCGYGGRLSATQRPTDTPAVVGAEGYPVGETLPDTTKVVTEENPTQAALWQLLKNAGYDTW